MSSLYAIADYLTIKYACFDCILLLLIYLCFDVGPPCYHLAFRLVEGLAARGLCLACAGFIRGFLGILGPL